MAINRNMNCVTIHLPNYNNLWIVLSEDKDQKQKSEQQTIYIYIAQ